MRRYSLVIVLAVSALLLAPPRAHAQQGLKVYISADMEGVAGVVTGEQLGPTGFEYERFRTFMTKEVLAAIAGVQEAGATEIVVSDSHGNGQNLLIDRFPADVTVVRGFPRPLLMMQGIDSTFDAAIFIGYHSATTNPAGVRAHTLSSANLTAVELNGVPVPEAGINAAIAGRFDVPVVMISGDDAAVAETKKLIGDVEGAVVKQAISFHSAATMTPEAAQTLIQQKAETALGRLEDFEPHALETPIRLDLTFKNYRPPQVLAYLPNVERTSSHSVRFVGNNMVEVSKFLAFTLVYSTELEP